MKIIIVTGKKSYKINDKKKLLNKVQVFSPLMIFFLLINIHFSYSQSRIHGKILDSIHAPFINANVLLLNSKDSLLVQGKLTNKSGAYSFDNVQAGSYLLTATYTGISPYYSQPFSISGKEDNIDMDIIQLKENTIILADVAIISKRPLYEQKIDRLLINVAGSITSAGSNVLDVLERSPGIIVNRLSNALSINGKSGVIVMINGKRNYMEMATVLQMLAGMPSGNIERIEIITTPPANYDAEGDAGIIDIILKSNNKAGTNGSYALMAGYNKGEQNTASLNLNHRKGKINLFGNYSFSRFRLEQFWTNYHAVTNAGTFMENYSESNRHALTSLHDGQAGFDYEINKKTIMGVLVTASYRHWSMEAGNNAFVSADHALDTSVRIINNELHTTRSYGINLNMQQTIRADEKFSINLDYLDYYDNNPNNYINSYYDVHNTLVYDEKLKSSKSTPLKFWIGTIDYQKKLSQKVDMEAGLKGTVSSLNNDVQVSTLFQSDWIKDTSLSGYHNLRENISAVYTSFSIALSEKISVKLGLRYEYANTNLGSPEQKNIVDRHYGNLFPSFFILDKINDSNSVNFSYSRRIWRPGFSDLAPWVIFYDPKTFQTGNPALQPAITDAVKASYTHKNKILSFSYSYSAHPISMQPLLEEKSNRLIISVANTRSDKNFNMSLSLPFQVIKWWNLQNNFTAYWIQSNSFYKQDIKLESTSYYITSTQTFTLPREISLELSGYFFSKSNWGLYTFKPGGSMDFGVQKKFIKKKSSLSFNIRNLLNTQTSRGYVNIPEQNLVLRTKQVYSYVNFSLSFVRSFGNDKIKEKRDRTTGAEDEKGRAY